MRRRLLLEEYSPTFYWIKGEKNIVADSMSRLPTVAHSDEAVEAREEVFATDLDVKFPMAFDNVHKEQQSEINKNKETRKMFRNNKLFKYKNIEGYELLMTKDKIYVPKKLRQAVLDWYHYYLCHPGATWLSKTIGQNLMWPGMVSECKQHVKTFRQWQRVQEGFLAHLR